MPSIQEIKHIASLRVPKYRELHGQTVAEGTKLIAEMLNSSFPFEEVYATAGWINKHPGIAATLRGRLQECSDKEMERMSALKAPQGVLAVLPVREHASPSGDAPLTLFCDRISDPGNMGTILRIADWFGIGQVMAAPDSVNFSNPRVVQASMGSWFRVHHGVSSLEGLIDCFDPSPAVYAAAVKGEALPGVKPILPAIIVVGNESEGISGEILKKCTHTVTIPGNANTASPGTAESLNAAIATAILCYHFTLFQP